MMVHRKRFNIYLVAALTALLACGCQSPETKKKKEVATLRLYIETNPHGLGHTQVASILREAPFDVTVEKNPFLTEGNVAEAKVINAMGGYAISVQFNTEGKMLLEQYTSANQGRKIAVFRSGEKIWRNIGGWPRRQFTNAMQTGCSFSPRTPRAKRPKKSFLA